MNLSFSAIVFLFIKLILYIWSVFHLDDDAKLYIL
nr:MAG TPA: hypothetical protein [Caudoviricetes sp.]